MVFIGSSVGLMSTRDEQETGEPILLTFKQTHQSLGVSRSTLYRLLAEGKVRPISRVGSGKGRMRFDAKEVHDYLIGAYHEPVHTEPELPSDTLPTPAPVRGRRSRSRWQASESA